MNIGVAVIAGIIIFVLFSYNGLVTRRNKIKQAKSSIDVYLTERFELIPNLVECVKGYMKHEQVVLEKVAELRASYNARKDLKTGAELNQICNNIIGVVEAHPDLKASEHVLDLQKSLSKIENQLQAARRLYNSEVTIYNTKIATIPTNIIASIFGFKEEELFEAEVGARGNVDVEI